MARSKKLSRYKLFYERVSVEKQSVRTTKNRPKRNGIFINTPKNILENIEL